MQAPEKRNAHNTFEQFAAQPPKLGVLTDHPVTDQEVKELFALDPFNFRFKLGPVYDILRYRNPASKDKDPHTPMGILISGDWGTGKTSAMTWLKTLLDAWTNDPKSGPVKIRTLWFYPWKYDNKEDVWRGLIAEVILHSMKKDATTKDVIRAFKTAALFYGKSAIDFISEAEITLGPLKLSGKGLKKLKKHLKDAVYPEKPYLNEYEEIIKKWVSESLAKDERMVIFIDDLDRCMPEIALQVLEALKLYLNIENLIFVVGVDKKVVENLVIEHYRKLGLVTLEEKNETEHKEQVQKAKQYLSKMFQVEVHLDPTEKQIEDFLHQQFPQIPFWTEHLSSEEQGLFRDLVLKFAGRNPRELKRVLNSALMMGAGAVMTSAPEEARNA